MKRIDQIKGLWLEAVRSSHNKDWFHRLEQGDIRLEHYIAYLRETFFHAGENPQIQAYSTVFLGRERRKLNKKYYQHAISEIGHDELALSDLEALGIDSARVRKGRALPATLGLIAYGYYSVQFDNPFGYLGYLFHLEFLPTTNGKKYLDILTSMGVPEAAQTFIHEHSTVDVHHNAFMERYVDELVQTDADVQKIAQSAATTCELHAQMIIASFEEAEKQDFQRYLYAG